MEVGRWRSPMIDRGDDIRQAIDVAAISGLHCGRWLWSVRAPD